MRTSPGVCVVVVCLFSSSFTGCVAMQPPRGASNAQPPRDIAMNMQPPRARATNAQPAYPFWARVLRRTGSVQIRMLIDEAGGVDEVQVLGVEGDASFVEAVLKVVRQWRFEPARHDGQPVRVWATKTVRFELDKPEQREAADAGD